MLVLLLPMDAASLLGPHRLQAGWEVCQERDRLWLRCPDGASPATAALPCTARYQADHAGRLIPWTGTLPVAVMPAGPWEALNVWLTAGPPSPSLPGRSQSRVEIRLERSSRERAPSALLLDPDRLLVWAETASRLRLRGLKFAASADGSGGGRVLVTGTPLPPVPGTACYFHGRLALPCGWDFPPPLWPAWVEQCLSLPQGALALLDPAGRVEILEQEGFTPLSLAAVRRTLAALPPPSPRPESDG